MNLERRAIQQDLLRRLPAHDGSAFDLVLDPEAHKGVIGIVAGHRMRENGVRNLLAYCTANGCHHEAVVNVDVMSDDVGVPSIGPRLR